MAHGHRNVSSTNRTTFEITKENHLTERGDCIIAVDATMSASELSQSFKELARQDDARITIVIEADGQKETVRSRGSSGLKLTHPTDLVVRKSSFVSDRTLAVEADKAACDFARSLVEKLRNPEQKVIITLTVEATT